VQGFGQPLGRHDAKLEGGGAGLRHDRIPAFSRPRIDSENGAASFRHPYFGFRLRAKVTGMPPVWGYTSDAARAMM
jgi:hypothetical protein